MTNIDTFRNNVHKAQEALSKAEADRDKAETKQAQAEAREAEKRAIERDGKNAARFLEYRDMWALITDAKAAFEQAVRSGGDTVAAYVNVRKAEAIVRTEHETLTNWKHKREVTKHDTAVNTLKPLAEQAYQLRQEANRNKWGVPSEYSAAFRKQVAEVNTSINEAAAAYGSEYRRGMTDLGPVHVGEVVDNRPSRTKCQPAGMVPPEQRDSTPYHVALEEAIRVVAGEAGAEHGRTRLN